MHPDGAKEDPSRGQTWNRSQTTDHLQGPNHACAVDYRSKVLHVYIQQPVRWEQVKLEDGPTIIPNYIPIYAIL